MSGLWTGLVFLYIARMIKNAFIIVFFLIIISCQKQGDSDPSVTSAGELTTALFTALDADQTGISFINEVEDGEEFNVLTYRNFYNGGGVAIGDLNNDGLSDVYFTANMRPNRLYLNKGNWQFEDITEQAGVAGEKAWSTGVTMADVNSDGFLDIYVCNSGDVKGDNKENELFINNGDLTFTESAAAFGLNDQGFSTHASFFDYDMDGDLDCYLLNNSFKDPERMDLYRQTREEVDHEGGDKLFKNTDGIFKDVSAEAGIYSSPIGFGLGCSVSDLNGDMWPDIYISNDFWERDYLYINQKNGTFEEVLTENIDLCSVSSMGADIADLNNDGAADIFSTDMLAADNYRLKAMTMFDPYHLEDLKYRSSFHYQILQNCLQLNNGDAEFQEIANLSGVSATDWSWGALIFDFDNNGTKDIFVSNAIFHEIMYLDFTNFINDEEEVRKIVEEKGTFDWRDFVEYMPSNPLSNFAFYGKTENGGIPVFDNMATDLGLGQPGFSNGAAYGDLDNDGDLDLIVNNVNMPPFIYQNGSTNNYVKLSLEGPPQNLNGIGTRVTLRIGTEKQMLQYYPSRGFESAVEPGLIFGIGSHNIVDELEVVWPDLKKQVLKNIPINETLTIKYVDASEEFEFEKQEQFAIFEDEINLLKGDHTHRENQYNDFNNERLLPRMVSTEGPPIICGDVNGDGKEDFILGGAVGDLDKLFIQTNQGWERHGGSWNELMNEDLTFETTCGALFDADGDGDNDLLLGSGGNEPGAGISAYLLRYYENDGRGNFTKVVEKTPPAAGNLAVIKPSDIDGDGDVDLFLGARIVPGNYGLPARSFILINDGNGKWTDQTTREIGSLGMVTDAVWSDTDSDGDDDLVVVGEWIPMMIFENNGGSLSLSQKQTSKPYSGWWNALIAVDLDDDGDDDYIAGNWGLNTKFKASDDEPLTMFVKDFDDNGKSEFIINWFAPAEEEAYPFATKMDITAQLPHLKKDNIKYEDYAHKKYDDLFSEAEREGAYNYKVNILETGIFWNQGNGFKWEALPLEAQVTPIFAIVCEDFNQDGYKDIWMGGNFYGLKPEVGRHDAGKGICLMGLPDRKFEYLSPERSGILAEGEVRDATVLSRNGESYVLISRNDKSVLLVSPNKKQI